MVLSVAPVRATSVTGSCCQGHLAAELDADEKVWSDGHFFHDIQDDMIKRCVYETAQMKCIFGNTNM